MGDVDMSRAPTEREMRELGFSFQIPEIEDVDIVVVDDDKTSLQLAVAHLERLGYPIRAFNRAQDALESIQDHPPKILLTDIVMPDMSGIELAEVARQHDTDIAVILVTSYGNESIADATIRLGVSDFLAKPVAINDLSRAVQRAFLRRSADDHHRAMVTWMYRALDRNATEIREVTLGTLSSLINAVDARSPHFRGHSRTVALQAAALAETMGLYDEEVEAIRSAGLLHDIGMIGIPDAVIEKPGSLTAEELEMIKGHCEAGVAIIQPMKHLGPSITYVLEHHERCDGSGYPHGKKGDEISLGGQIVGISEAWTAIIESRAYRQGRSRAEGFEILLGRQGEWFTEDVTQALVESDIGAI